MFVDNKPINAKLSILKYLLLYHKLIMLNLPLGDSIIGYGFSVAMGGFCKEFSTKFLIK